MKIRKAAIALTAKIFFTSWIGALSLRYSGIIEHPTIDIWTFVLFGVFALPFFALGLLALTAPGCHRPSENAQYEGNIDSTGPVYIFCQLLAGFYLALIILDKIVLGDVLTTGVTEARYAAMGEGARNSILGALHYFLAGAPAILACLLLSRQAKSLKSGALPWILAIAGFISFFLSGGRNSFVVSTLFVFFYFSIERNKFYRSAKPRRIHPPTWIVASGILGFFYAIYLFSERAAIRGTDLTGAAQLLMENYDLIIWRPNNINDFFLQIYYALSYLVFYLTHAPTYVSQYMAQDYSPLTMGAYGFNIFFRIFDILAGTHFGTEAFDKLLISGVYMTLPGTAFIDFGWPGVFISSVVISGTAAVVASKAQASRTGSGIMGASLTLSILALSPFFFGLSIGNGLSIFFLLIALRAFNGIRRFKTVIYS